MSVPWGVFGTGISHRCLCNPAGWIVDILDVLPLKVVGFGGGNPKDERKGSHGGPLWLNTGNFATTDFASISDVGSY